MGQAVHPPDPKCSWRRMFRTAVADTTTPSPFSSLRCADTPIADSRALPPQDQLANLEIDRPSASAATRRPPPGDQPTMPLQRRGRLDDEHRPDRAWQQSTGGGQERSIRRRESRPRGLAAQHRQLMAQHNDLQFLEVTGTKPKDNQLKHASKRNVADGQEHDAYETKKRRLFYTDRICARHTRARGAR
jgi:hypothetical protein